MRIAVFGLRGIPEVMGGVERHCQELYPRLVEKGGDVTIFARKGYVLETPYCYKGVKVVPLWSPKNKNLETVFHSAYCLLAVLFQRKSFELIHIHAIGPSLLVPFARLLGFNVVMTHHGPDYDRKKWGSFAKKVLKLGEMLGCKFSNKVICVSKNIKTTIKTLYDVNGVYIPNGTPLPEIVSPGKYLDKWQLKPQRYLLCVGRFVPEKGFHDIVDAFRSIDEEWKLVLVGDADHEDEYSRNLKKMAKKNGKVVLTGFLRGEELAEIYSNAGLFVLPSYHEGLPIALLEAMSYDLPILASNIPANLELASPDEVFQVGNVEQLNLAIKKNIKGGKARSKGRKLVSENNSWDMISEKTLRLYSDVIR